MLSRNRTFFQRVSLGWKRLKVNYVIPATGPIAKWLWGDNAGTEKWGDAGGTEKWGDNL